MPTANRVSAGSAPKLQLRPGDSALTLKQLLGLALFKGLSSRAEARLRGPTGQGVAVLRLYRAGDVICRQGEPGWTAFYLLQIDDRLSLRESQEADANASQALLALRSEEIDAVSDLGQPVPDGDAGTAALARDDVDVDVDVDALRQAVAARPSADELRALRAERDLLSAGDRSEAELALSHSGLLALTPEQQRQRADAMAGHDDALATKLRQSADSTERRMLAQVWVRRAAAQPPIPKGPKDGLLARILGTGAPQVAAQPAEPGPDPDVAIGTLYEGELFGELSCLYHTPRSATVRALRDCYVLEFLGVVLDLLLTSEHVQAELNEVYRRRNLGPQLRAVPLFAQASDEAIELLRQGATLISLLPGEALYEEGARADSLYLVRSGTVALHSGTSGRVLGYRSRGELVGEHALVQEQPRTATCVAYQHPRSEHSQRVPHASTLRVELVRIDRALFDAVCARSPTFRRQVERRLLEAGSEAPTHATQRVQTTARFSQLGLHQGRQLMLIDLDTCTLCGDCVSACASVQADSLPRLSLHGPRFGKYVVPASCRKCHDAACLSGCPVGAIHRGAASQIIIEDWCIGCGLCAAKCPYEAIDLRRDEVKLAIVCDQCAARPAGPECVRACPHDAAQRVDAPSFFARLRVV